MGIDGQADLRVENWSTLKHIVRFQGTVRYLGLGSFSVSCLSCQSWAGNLESRSQERHYLSLACFLSVFALSSEEAFPHRFFNSLLRRRAIIPLLKGKLESNQSDTQSIRHTVRELQSQCLHLFTLTRQRMLLTVVVSTEPWVLGLESHPFLSKQTIHSLRVAMGLLSSVSTASGPGPCRCSMKMHCTKFG